MRPQDWTADFSHENGNYQRNCICCKTMFLGHKRRVVCKVCHDESERAFFAMSPEEQQAALEKNRREMEEYAQQYFSL